MKTSVIMVLAILSASANAADFFYKATATFKDGSKKEFNCERAAGAINKDLRETYSTSTGNKYHAYNVLCTAGQEFSGVYFKFPQSEPAVGKTVGPFQGNATLENQTNIFTARVKTSKYEMDLHSFAGSPQHFTGTPKLTITEFKDEAEGAKTFHVIAGNGSVDFEEKKIDRKMGAAGKMEFSFRMRARSYKIP